MPLDLKIRLIKIRKKQVDLLDELHKRGFSTLTAPRLNTIINGRYKFGCASDVLEESDKIITQWENKK